MNVLMIVLRIIHIFAGIFWVGVSFFNIHYLQPSIRATAPDGQKVMQHLTQKTNLTNVVYGASTLTMLSGLLMYGYLFEFRMEAMTSPYGLVLGIGGLSGIVAWVIAIIAIRNIFTQMGAVGKAIQEQGGPPTPEQAATLGELGAQLTRLGRVGLILMTISVIGMAAAQYIS
jgi:uncharacterized membrane protein